MRTFWQDVRFGLRLLRGSPGFTAVAVLTLALGIAAITTVFSWIDGLLLRPYPGVSQGHELAVIETIPAFAPATGLRTSFLDFKDYRDSLRPIASVAAHREEVFRLGEAADGAAVWGELVSGDYFAVLGVQPALGRVFATGEYSDEPGAHPIAVISDRLWRNRFRADPRIVGQRLRVNRRELTVVGVAAAPFRGTWPGLALDIWIPFTMGIELGTLQDAAFKNRGTRSLYVTARLNPGVSVEQARDRAVAVARRLAETSPNTNRGYSATVEPAWKSHNGAAELLLGPLRILMAVAVLVFLIVCANVANLLLARSTSRQREFAVRQAMGASRARLARQLLVETLLLGVAGAALGLPLAIWMSRSLPSMIPNVGVPVAAGFQLSGRILAFTILACGAAALISGAAPALLSFRADLNETLKEGSRGGSSGSHSHRVRGLLVIAEVALAVVALVGAGLFIRSFQNARAIHPGFDKNNVLLLRFYLATAGYSVEEVQQFCARLRDRLRSAPGVTDAVYADYAPLGSPGGPYTAIEAEGYVPGRTEQMDVHRTLVAPGYFQLLRIPLLAGRDFTENDDPKAAPVTIVNRAFAQRYFSGTNPVGRKVRFWGQWWTVVGMVATSKHMSPSESPLPYFYVPFRQRYTGGGQVYVFARTAGDPMNAVATVRREIAAIDPNAAAFHPVSLAEWTEVTLLAQRIAATLVSMLGLVSLVLAAVGLYAVMAYAVSRRTREIGIRMALGAQRGNVLAGVLGQGMALTAGGLVAGIAASLAVTRLAGSMLVNVSAADPLTFAAAALFLTAVALLATYLPARRATKVNPMIALRTE